LVFNTGAVNGVAVLLEWVVNIIKSATNKLGNERDFGPVIKRDGISFDGKLVLMLVGSSHPFRESESSRCDHSK
jgi:hypothetical protein